MSKIPNHAKCVFKGVLFDVYQWEQKLYDGTSTTFEMLKRKPATQILALSEGDVFYVEETQPRKSLFLSLFGGNADSYDELPLETAKRELLEESGMVSEDWTLFSSLNSLPKIDWDFHTYIARGCKKVQKPKLDSGEKITVKKASIDQFIDSVLFQPDFQAYGLKKAFSQKPDINDLDLLKKMLKG